MTLNVESTGDVDAAWERIRETGSASKSSEADALTWARARNSR
jgi:hypothetical protein